MKNILTFLYLILKYGRSRIFLFRPCSNAFRDNCKYAHITLAKKYPKAKFIWITSEENQIKHFQELGITAYSWEKNYRFLRYLAYATKYHFCDGGWVLDERSYFNKSFNFWHGALGKYNMYDELGEPQRNAKTIKLLKRNAKNMFLVNISDFVNKYLCKSYRLCEFNPPLILGQPRIKPLITPLKNIDEFITPNDIFLKRLQKDRTDFDAIYGYFPTYRDNGADFLKGLHLDLDALNEALAKKNALMVFKMHPLCNLKENNIFTNIRFADKHTDIYPLVSMCDVVISDYSSLYFDVLICKNKKILLLHGDIEPYQKDRPINKAHLQDMKKTLVLNDFKDLIDFIKGNINHAFLDRQQLIEKYWDKKVIENPDIYINFIK